ncbi:hypothetical protein AcV5_005078 [Taiwanofungus camphoratus]|nr:hypothetical protein AcV5_005078 [Antrodia cinnamomea]
MKLTKRYDDRIEGNLNAITDISNGILRDERVFHMDTSDWLIRLNTQSEFEGNVLGGWARGGVKIVQEEAAERLKSHGWDAVRSALSVTIRAWLMSGYLSHKNDSSQERALQLLNSAVSVLEWGASLWRNIPKEERGVIFEKTFVRGVKRLRIEAYMKACKNAGPTSSYNVEELMTMARDMIDDVDANPPTEFSKYDPGYVLSFWQYPKAGALAALGFCQMKRAVILKNDETEENHVEIARSYFAEAAHSYMTAAETYPEDDELHVYFLKIAFETFWHRGLPLRESLPLCALIRGGVPKARKIWGYSVFSRTLNKHIDQVLRFQRDAMRGLLVGEYTMDTPSSSIAFT